MTTSLAEDGFSRGDNLRQAEDDIFYMYGSTTTHVTEETEYVRKIRNTLEKIQSQLFKDDVNGKTLNSTQDKISSHLQNDCSLDDLQSFASRYKRIIENLNNKDEELVEMNKENEDLQIKLEATREAGASVVRSTTRRLYENYSKQSDQLRKAHKDETQKMQVSAAEHEETLKKSVDKLNEVAEKIQEKHGRITELENLMHRMEAEKASLLDKKRSLENELLRRMSSYGNTNSCVAMQTEICTLQEQVNHLQQLMMSQHQSLRCLIQESEELKSRLKEQDERIGDLKERVDCLEHQNKELKQKVGNLSNQNTAKASKGISVNEFMLDRMSPYYMLLSQKHKAEKS
ncbi:coiled-coil domain-containing protein 68 [Bombina bombina]|uniref:coiled-coil domain-containing protein 68 n=1 Tax=Bombina bombina TaxID=8345 RepID=UPI00235A4B61|nr:coiled-coil domain-containing protein 68 [Bombina bombina]